MFGTLTIGADTDVMDPLEPPYRWRLSEPLFSPTNRPDDPCFSVKDPTVVRYGGKWHLFTTVRSRYRTHQIEYAAFRRWEDADSAPRHLLKCRHDYFCAPQVFYFRPQKLWYLIYQVAEPDRQLGLQPAYSTIDDINDPNSWSEARLFFPNEDPPGVTGWIDYWVICDDVTTFLFFTSLDGRMWRMKTPKDRFPNGFEDGELALQADIYEASHTYFVRGRSCYLTLIESQGRDSLRYYKAYIADRLDGIWHHLGDSEDMPFAGRANVVPASMEWADNISHGELVRDGFDEMLTVDPNHIEFLVQGVLQDQKVGKPYGEIPWRLGLLSRI